MPRPTTTPHLTPGAPYVTCACRGMRVHRGPAPARTCLRCGRIVCRAHTGEDLHRDQKCVCTECADERKG